MFDAYFKNLCYLIRHKYYVFLECIKLGMPLHAITHDLSKFLPLEFHAYSLKFHVDNMTNVDIYISEKTFLLASTVHRHRNKHHHEYWVHPNGKPAPMPKKYVKQMIADWRAMGKVFEDDAIPFYHKNKHKMILHPQTRWLIKEIIYERR